MAIRERLVADLWVGNISLISFQQAIGGSLSWSDRATEDAEMEDVEPLNCRQQSVDIGVLGLAEIKVPEALHPPSIQTSAPPLTPSCPPSHPPSPSRPTSGQT